MLKDIEVGEVDTVALAVVPSKEKGMWSVYLINQGDYPLEMVMVSSRGYGEIKGERKETATLRSQLGDVDVGTSAFVEELAQEVCSLNNEFLVTFFCQNKFFDKRVVFEPGTIHTDFLEDVPVISKKGILIK